MTMLVVFTEEMSAKAMLDSLLPRLLPAEVPFRCVAFEGKHLRLDNTRSRSFRNFINGIGLVMGLNFA